MRISENHPLKSLNTFGIDAYARYYTELHDQHAMQALYANTSIFREKHLLLGEGSNILFSQDFDGTVIRMMFNGKEVTGRDNGHVFLRVKAGENWDDLVAYCVSNGWGGLENLSLIPGQVGSSPIQNIGAYGTELKDTLVALEAFDKETGQHLTFSHDACQFGYRTSVFKGSGRGRYIITAVTFRLDEHPKVNTRYGSVTEELENMGVSTPTIADVREAVCRIRRSKLPDPEELGNAGSFFKNPVISEHACRALKQEYPDMVVYPTDLGMKLAAGWLIDQAGWKGYRQGDAGVHHKQALVLVNHGNASGKDILNLADRISESVNKRFGVHLEPEVNIMRG